jgi:HEPN domain-containing protein
LHPKNEEIMMTKEEKVAYWLDIADYDIETAEAMYKTKRWLYVAFMCHQTIEKTLKAYWSFVRDDMPPKTHNHMRLADECGLY